MILTIWIFFKAKNSFLWILSIKIKINKISAGGEGFPPIPPWIASFFQKSPSRRWKTSLIPFWSFFSFRKPWKWFKWVPLGYHFQKTDWKNLFSPKVAFFIKKADFYKEASIRIWPTFMETLTLFNFFNFQHNSGRVWDW